MDRDGEASAQDAFWRVPCAERLEGGSLYAEPCKGLVGRFKVGERLETPLSVLGELYAPRRVLYLSVPISIVRLF